jgi:hypothetical protein
VKATLESSFVVRQSCLRFVASTMMSLRLVAISLLAMISFVLADPTMYKKNEQNLYEPGRNGEHVK